MNFKRSICSCLSILTFAPLSSSQAMKESEPGILEMQHLSADDSSKLLNNDSDSDGYEILRVNDIINYMGKEEIEERENKKLGVHNLDCPICDDENSLDSTIALKCGHMFHQSCMEVCWCAGYFQCPLCKQVFDKLRARLKKIKELQRLRRNLGMSKEDIRERDTRFWLIDGPAGDERKVLEFLYSYYTSDAYQWGHEELECSACDADYGIIFVKRYEGNKEERVPFVIGKRPATNADIVAAIRCPKLRKDFDRIRDMAKSIVSSWSAARREHYQRTSYNDSRLQNEEANPLLQNDDENRDRCVTNTIRRVYNGLPPWAKRTLFASIIIAVSKPLVKKLYFYLLQPTSNDYNVENVEEPSVIVTDPTEDNSKK